MKKVLEVFMSIYKMLIFMIFSGKFKNEIVVNSR